MEKKCPRCTSTAFRRLTRRGWLECGPLTWIGYFPWECVICRRKSFFKDAGTRLSDRGHV